MPCRHRGRGPKRDHEAQHERVPHHSVQQRRPKFGGRVWLCTPRQIHDDGELEAAPSTARRVEDRIREAKATGLRNLPCHRAQANAAWLEIILAATDLVAWAQLLGFTDQPELARCEIDTFRCRVLHVAARITRGARQIRLRIDVTWHWATAICQGWQRLREAFP